MQADGLKLSAIKRLIGEHGASAEGFVGLREVITAPFDAESPEVLSSEELGERFGVVDDKTLARARNLGLLHPLGDGTFEVPSPALLRAAEEVLRRDIPLDAALAAMEKVRRSARTASRAFVELFLDELWKPFERAGQPDERWPEITESIERLRPLASEALLALFKQTLAVEVEEAFGKVLEQQAKARRRA